MRKVMIIGPGCAGKTTLSLQLGEKLGLPVFHLDKYYWLPNWTERSETEWKTLHDELIQNERWIMDGSFSALAEDRARAADTIIYLKYGRPLVLYRWLKRFKTYRGKTRPDMTEGNTEYLRWQDLLWLITYSRRAVYKTLKKYEPSKKIYVFKRPRDLDAFLSTLGTR